MPLIDDYGVLPMDPSFHPLLARQVYTSRGKRKRMGRASNSKVVMDSDNEDPFSSARVEEDPEDVCKMMRNDYANFSIAYCIRRGGRS